MTAADGSVIPADGLLEILSVDENGHAVCKTDLPFGSFYLKELSTDEHYILSDEKHPIVLTTQDRTPPLWKSKQMTANRLTMT